MPAESVSWGQMRSKAVGFCLHQQLPVTQSRHYRELLSPKHLVFALAPVLPRGLFFPFSFFTFPQQKLASNLLNLV